MARYHGDRGAAALGHRDVRVPSLLITVWDQVAAATAAGASKAGAGRAGQRGRCSVISPWGQGWPTSGLMRWWITKSGSSYVAPVAGIELYGSFG